MSYEWYNNVPRDWLVWEWLLDGNALDTSWEWNDWTASNITWVDAERGYVWETGSFNGSSSWIDLNASVINTNQTFSFNLWFKADSWWTNKWRIISFNGSSDCRLRYKNSWDVEWAFYDWTTDPYLINSITEWELYMATIVRDKTVWMKMYLNWVLLQSNSETWNAISLSESDSIWYREWNNSDYFDWQVWLIRIYNKAISQKEINNLYQEWFRKFWPSILQQYPELFEWCVWYWNVEDWTTNYDNLIDWTRATKTAWTNTADQLWLDKAITNPNYTWSSLTYTNSYIWKNDTFTKNDSGISATWVNITWDVWAIYMFNKTLSSDEETLLEDITSKKYIYPFAKYTPQSLPKPKLHLDWTNNWTTWYDQSWNWNNWTQVGGVISWRIWQSKYSEFDWVNDYIDVWDIYSWSWSYVIKTRFRPDVSATSIDYDIIFRYSDNLWYDTTRAYYWWYANNRITWKWLSWNLADANNTLNIDYTFVIWKTYDIAFVLNDIDKTAKCFINWVLHTSWSFTGSLAKSNRAWPHKMSFGNRWYNANEWFNWKMIDQKFIEAEVTDKQIEEDFYSNYIS